MSLVLDDLPRDPDRLLQHLRQMAEVVARQNASLVSLRAEHDTVLAERDAAQAEIEKLRLLIRQLQRGRFGRRSEKLDPDQLQLGLEDLEQAVAAAEAAQEAAARSSDAPRPPRARRRNLGALPAHLPRVEVLVDVEDKSCPCCGGTHARHRRGHERDARHRPRRAAGEGDPPPALRLPGLRGGGGAGARPGAADHRRDGDRGPARARAGGQVRRFPAALPPGPDLRPARDRARPLHAVRLGRPGLLVAGAAVAPAAPARHELDPDLRRRHHAAGARPRPGPDQDRAAVGLRDRRPALGREHPAGGGLPLRRGPQGRAPGGPPGRVPGRAAGGRLLRVQAPAREPAARRDPARLLLGALPEALLRDPPGDRLAAGGGGAAPDRRALRGRGRDPRPPGRGAEGGPAGAQQAGRGRPARLAHRPAGAGLGQVRPGRGDPLRPAPLAGAGAVPRRRPARAGHQHRRAGDPADRLGAQE